MVTVFIERQKKTLTEEYKGKIKVLVEKLGVNPETVVVIKNGEIVSEEDNCTGEDELKLLSVISGG